MTPEILTVLGILIVAIFLFVTEWVRMDLVALMVLAALAVAGLVTPAEALSGFSNPAAVTVWAILILSGGLARTGLAGVIGRRLMKLAGNNEIRMLVIIMITAGVMSGFMNTIGVVALFLPIVLDISRRTKRPPSRLLMPLAFASLLGGLNTLIGTPPNILISAALADVGLVPFSMFDYTPVGLSILAAGTLYMTLIGRKLLPERDLAREFSDEHSRDYKSLYALGENMVILHLPEDSILHGRTLAESRLGAILGLNVVAVIRDHHTHLSPNPSYQLYSDDRLLVEGHIERLSELHERKHLIVDKDRFSIEQLVSEDVELSEAVLSHGSNLVGRTLRQVDFRNFSQVVVLAIRRGEVVYRTNLESINLQPEDKLLLHGHHQNLDNLRKDDPNLIFSTHESLADYGLEEHFLQVHIPQGSLLTGKSLNESRLGESYGLGVLGIIHNGETHLIPAPDETLREGDTLLVKGKRSDLQLVEGLQNLEIEKDFPLDMSRIESDEIGLQEAMLSPHSTLVGRNLRELNFRIKYGLNVLAIWRSGRAYRSDISDMSLRLGDAILLYGPRNRLQVLGSEPDFLVLSEGAQEPPRSEKIPLALLIMAVVLVPAIFGWLPIAISAIIGVSLMILTGVLTMDEAYRYIEWKAIFLIAGMIPIGLALEQTGTANFLAQGLIGAIGGLGPLAVMGGFFLLATVASQFMPNPVVAVLLAPIALSTAGDLGISPYTLMMTVAVAASAAFLSPIGHAANLMVMGPGGYKFSDYFKVGLPLTLIVFVVVMLTMPVFWPF